MNTFREALIHSGANEMPILFNLFIYGLGAFAFIFLLLYVYFTLVGYLSDIEDVDNIKF